MTHVPAESCSHAIASSIAPSTASSAVAQSEQHKTRRRSLVMTWTLVIGFGAPRPAAQSANTGTLCAAVVDDRFQGVHQYAYPAADQPAGHLHTGSSAH